MNRIHSVLYILIACLLFACEKDSTKPPLATGSVSIMQQTGKDTLIKEMSVAKDSPVILTLKATLDGGPSAQEHIVTFKADSTKLTAYRLKYGNATLLPYGFYLFFKNQCRIPAGSSVSDAIQLNLLQQTKLKPETMYVLPVVIQQVDGNPDAVAPGNVFYIIVKTGKSPVISKASWTIASFSSQNSSFPASFLIDTDPATLWISDYAAMPQNVVINFNASVTFSGVSYSLPATWFAWGGYPTKLQIEVSTDGSTWVNKGTFNGVITSPLNWQQSIGVTTAKYLRFTVLEAAPYTSGLPLTGVGDISLIP